MDLFWLSKHASQAQASFKGVREAQPRVAAPEPRGAEAGSPFLAQIEQVVGVETEPDAEFFVDSWTVGVAAASEGFLRRQELKRREYQNPAWDTFSSFTPWFVSNVEASSGAAWSPGEQRLMADLLWVDDEDEVDGQAADEGMEGPLTVESARRLLGVAETCTREQIRVAYRKMASRYHPDRLARATAREQELANDRMARINEAHRLLCMDLVGREKDRCIM